MWFAAFPCRAVSSVRRRSRLVPLLFFGVPATLIAPPAVQAQDPGSPADGTETPAAEAVGNSWNLLAFGGGQLLGSLGNDGGAGTSWEAGGGVEFIAGTGLGGRLTGSWLVSGDDFAFDAGLVWQFDRTSDRAWYLSGGLAGLLFVPYAGSIGDANVIMGLAGSVGVSGPPDAFGLGVEVRAGLYEGPIFTLGARLFMHIGPL